MKYPRLQSRFVAGLDFSPSDGIVTVNEMPPIVKKKLSEDPSLLFLLKNKATKGMFVYP